MQSASQVSQANAHQAPGTGRNARAKQYAGNAKQWVSRNHRWWSRWIRRAGRGWRGAQGWEPPARLLLPEAWTVTTAEKPGRSTFCKGCPGSSAIFTGILCTTLVKLPVALSGGSRANCDPLAGEI